MPQKENLKNLFASIRERQEGILAVKLNHPTTQGDHCEQAWIEYLENFLPKRYAVAKGRVYDSDGNESQQIDIIIYDPFYTPLILTTCSGEKFVAAESVYAVFDCKPKITKENLEYTSKKIESVTSLNRKKTYVIDNGEKKNGRDITPIIGGILATESIEASNLERHLCNDYTNIDIGYAPSDLCFIRDRLIRNRGVMLVKDKESASGLFFCGLLELLHSIGTVAPIDNLAYAKYLTGESLFEVKND